VTDHAKIAPALVAALADLTTVATGRTADAGTYSYKYADIADVVRLTRPVLASHGLVALTPLHDHGDGLACSVVILHDSGERLDFGPFPFPHGKDAQATGSMVTYHRRYALVAALGMAAGDDDDGKAAQPRVAERPRSMTPRQAAKAHLLELCDGDADKAKEAWREMGADSVTWHANPAGEIEGLWLEWVNGEPVTQ
jgi:hypothetical protein